MNEGEPMFHIVYVSAATADFSRAHLMDLLIRARANNTRLGVTGLLIHKDGRFVQVLEGEKSVVNPLFETIYQDGRHQSVTPILAEPIGTRQFEKWSMGFHDLNPSDLLGLYGHNKPLGRSLNIDSFRSDPQACLHLLRFIKDLNLA
jgi:hypothetical protein